MRKMKDSGIAWIGEIPAEWKVKRIKHIIIQTKDGIKIGPFGSALTNKTHGNGEYNVYSQANLISANFSSTKNTIDKNTFDELKSYEVYPNDICLSMMGTIGKCLKVPDGIKRGIMDSHLIKIRLSGYVDSRFFEYTYDKDLSGVCFQQMQYDKKGFIMDGLNTSIVKNLYFPLPPLDEQRRIAAFLDNKCAHIDAVIEKTRASIDEYKKLKQAVITCAVTKGIRKGRKMKDSGIEWIGEIPENWDLTPIKNIGNTSSGATPLRAKEKDYFTDANIPWIKTLDLNEAEIFDCSEMITQEAVNSSSCSIMPVNTVCVAMYGGAGTIGKCGLLKIEAATNQAVCSIITNDRISPQFLLYHLIAIRKDWMYYAVGTRKDPNISQDIVARMKIAIPPLPEQQEIAAYLDAKTAAIDRLIAKKEQLVAEMESCKKSLIYEVVTGKREAPISKSPAAACTDKRGATC